MTDRLKKNKNQAGSMIIYLIIVIFIFSIVMVPILSIILNQINALKSAVAKEQALQIAEAGINYYQWRLSHFSSDYKDGQTNSGPYVHTYTDRDTQDVIGGYSLVVTPPSVGSTIATIQSTGWTNAYPNVKRTITVKYGIQSLAKYSILNNGEAWIYYSPTIFSGQVHSNNGVRFDVQGNAPIYSAKSTYTTTCFGFCASETKNGVWGSGNSSFWQFPVPAVDFSAFTSNLATMKSTAQSGGIYLPPSNQQGYSLVFNSDGTVSIYKVGSLRSNPSGGTYDVNMNWITISQNTDYDPNSRTLQFTQSIPANGMIYVEDNIWVQGTVRGRITVAAAKLPYSPSTAPTIYIPDNIVYSAKDGRDVLGLIGQKDVVPTYYAANNLEIDAAIISQNSSFQFYYYNGDIKDIITVYGAIIEFGWWFDNLVWTSGISNNVIAGYTNSYYNYDANLLYAPPPYFPLSTSGYQQLNWASN